MLVYKQVEAPAAAAAAAASGAGSTSAAAESLPEPLRSKALEMLQAFRQECEQYQGIRDEALQKLQQRQQHVRNVLEAATCPSDESDSGRWLSYAWLENWASSSEPPGPIDNSVLLCPHSKLDHSKVTAMKRISTQAWSELQVSGGPGGMGGCEAGRGAGLAGREGHESLYAAALLCCCGSVVIVMKVITYSRQRALRVWLQGAWSVAADVDGGGVASVVRKQRLPAGWACCSCGGFCALLQEQFRGGPELSTSDTCMACLKGLLHEVGDAEEADDKREAFLAMLEVRGGLRAGGRGGGGAACSMHCMSLTHSER